MALPTQNWRAVTPVALASGTIASTLDALYTIGQAATYSDGSGRTPGSGSAWTWNRQQVTGTTVAAWGVPPTNALQMGYIVAGSSSASTPQMMSGIDNFTLSAVHVAMNKNSGSPVTLPNSWQVGSPTSPFGAGQFSGYIVGGAGTTNGTMYYWECQEGFIVQVVATGGTSSYVFGGGAFVDPLNSSAGNCESDGRLYSVFTTGGNKSWATNWSSSGLDASYGVFKGRDLGGKSLNSRFALFNVGSVNTCRQAMMAQYITTATSYLTPSGDVPLLPYSVVLSGASNNQIGPFFGELRNIYYTRAAAAGQTITNGGTTVGYILSPQASASNTCLALKY
jgi:hypothetical protein